MINRSLDQSQFKIAFDYLNMFKMSACIYCNHCLILYSILNVYTPITIHFVRHSSSERSTGFVPISHHISMPGSKWAAASSRTIYQPKYKEKLVGVNLYSEINMVAWHRQPVIGTSESGRLGLWNHQLSLARLRLLDFIKSLLIGGPTSWLSFDWSTQVSVGDGKWIKR
jgi:hypothetical protein